MIDSKTMTLTNRQAELVLIALRKELDEQVKLSKYSFNRQARDPAVVATHEANAEVLRGTIASVREIAQQTTKIYK
jgi:hypothetical protein